MEVKLQMRRILSGLAAITVLVLFNGCYWTDYLGQEFPPVDDGTDVVLYRQGKDEPDWDKYEIIGRMTVHGISSRSYFHLEDYMLTQARKRGGDAVEIIDYGMHEYSLYPTNENDFGTPSATPTPKHPVFGNGSKLSSNEKAVNRRQRMRVLVLKNRDAVKKYRGE